MPPDEVEEIRQGFRSTEHFLEQKLASMLHSVLPVESSTQLTTLISSHCMDVIRDHTESQLNICKSRGVGISSKDRTGRTLPRTRVRKRASIPQGGGATDAPHMRNGDAEPTKPRPILPAWPSLNPSTFVTANYQGGTTESWENIGQSQAVSAVSSFASVIGNLQIGEVAGGYYGVGGEMVDFNLVTQSGDMFSQCFFCRGSWPCSCRS